MTADFKTIADSLVESSRALIGPAAEDYRAMLVQLQPDIEHFIQQGDTAQLEIVGFRFRTLARNHAVQAIRNTHDHLWQGVLAVLTFIIKAAV